MKHNTDEYVRLLYGKEVRAKKGICPHSLHIENLVNLGLEIKSNSKGFLRLMRREYCIFLMPQVKRYYKKNFSIEKNIHIDVFFFNETAECFIKAFGDIERHIKYFLWGRFIILHASCVRYNGFDLFFAGRSYSGKSTICSALHEKGGRVLSDDNTILENGTGKLYMFPTFIGAIRTGVKTHIQKEHFGHFNKYEKLNILEKMITMDKNEFATLFSYHKKLYGIKEKIATGSVPNESKKVFILLKKDEKQYHKNKILTCEKPMKMLPELMQNLASNYLQYRKLIKEAIDLFLKSECYVLRRAPLDLMISAICSKFG